MAGIDIDIEGNSNSNPNNNNNNNNNNNYNEINNSSNDSMNNSMYLTKKSSIDSKQVGKFSLIAPEDVVAHDVFYSIMIFVLGFIFYFPFFFSSFYVFNTQSGTIKKIGFASICLFSLYTVLIAILYWSIKYNNYY
ncbi:hypothetical protein DDB_G0278231 [Dictyostelium discoideum AX4]|uniref:Transmembrane protein n=1 Tax=Dictyostelium discoideum TaxID=44689 RepID=Q54YH8_DICDI|nr:hypothetical protein DDB_G0278231 [Dictyostelium discoideum AX4]EAL68288.2 hypothetical protein DDB_G0278231 [Dictyostelium discoideum AX4]|eukprot:XP_642224.2 hypothetical protein DDB_G0278231 [Dictyostelium discoideum AX4]